MRQGEKPPKLPKPMEIEPFSRISFGPVIQKEYVDTDRSHEKSAQSPSRNLVDAVPSPKFHTSQLNIHESATPLSTRDQQPAPLSQRSKEEMDKVENEEPAKTSDELLRSTHTDAKVRFIKNESRVSEMASTWKESLENKAIERQMGGG